ncbi:hypothetical protein [Mycolicibacterium tusciae]|uniref:hypothetical protein n=1 Tax=Mycolicibacterium tusciae TaxID=75922 RepID=UPI001EF7C2A5|nr:hypothetical protein [Mycolicibacterium tusciae]
MASEQDVPTHFRSANDRIAQLVDDPMIADEVRQLAAERERVNEISGDPRREGRRGDHA